MKKCRKNPRGITLIALIITIIILLILAGISISALTNQGLFARAQEAKDVTEQKTAEENAILNDYLAQMNEILGSGGTEGTGETEETLVITLALSSTSGTVVDGASQTATISGSNYGTLSVTSSDASIATASISGNTLTVTGTITSGTNNATITVAGSEGVSATYTVTAHKHTGDSTSGGGCYTKATTRSYSYECSGCREESYEYKCSGCEVASEECVNYDEETGRCTGWSRQMYCPGHEGTRTYCPGHIGYTTTYSMECGF